jgi:hypothetical protein
MLAAIVLAVHLWLLGGMPRMFAPPAQRAQALVARTVAPVAPVAPEVVKPEIKTEPAPAKQETTARPAHVAVARPHAIVPASAKLDAVAAPSTAILGAAPARPTAPTPTRAFAVAPSARFHYDVTAQTKGFTLKGQAQLDWRNENGQYEAQLQMTAPFVRPRVQRSTGLITAEGLAPVRFSDKARTEEAAHFDREQGKVVFSSNKPEALLAPGAQDRLSIVMQLGAMIAGKPSKFPAGSQITVQTASTKEAEPWTFTVEGAEALNLPGGRTKTLRLTRNPRKEYDVKVELWLAPGAAYAPVRLRLTQPNGDWVDQQWSSTDRG